MLHENFTKYKYACDEKFFNIAVFCDISSSVESVGIKQHICRGLSFVFDERNLKIAHN